MGGNVDAELGRRKSIPELHLELQGSVLIVDFNVFVLDLDFNLVPPAESDRGFPLRGDRSVPLTKRLTRIAPARGSRKTRQWFLAST
jgi:hypothetical protein